jgi:hypothetical protein
MSWPVADRSAAFPSLHRSFSLAIRNALVFLLGATALLSTAQTVQPDDQPKKVSGTVINSVTKAPIPRALVSTSDNRFAMLTDGEGHFEFTVPKETTRISGGSVFWGSHQYHGCSSWLQARKPGYLDCIDSQPGSQDSELTIALVPEALIHGQVSVSSSEPLSGTEVQLFYREVMNGLPRWMPRTTVRTNSAGEFRFPELPAGEYKLLTHERTDDDPAANLPGRMYAYPPVFYPGAADFGSAETIHVSAGQSVEADLVATRQPYFRVNIPVSNSDISSGLNVTVRSQAGPGYSLGYSPVTKRIEGSLPNGNYVVEATVYGPNAASGVVNLKVNGTAAESPAMTLVPVGSITLDVKEQFTDKTPWNGQSSWSVGNRTITVHGPRAYVGAQLEVADDSEPNRGGGNLRPPTGPNDESFVLENVLPGRYWLRVNTGRGYVASARVGDVDLLRQPLVVTPGPSAPIEVELRDDTAELDGTVTGIEPVSAGPAFAGNRPQAWIYCIPLPDSPGQFNQTMVQEEGQFQHPMLAPGDYRILAFASQQQHLPYREAEAMKAYETRGPVVHLAAGQKVSVQVPLINDSDVAEK